MWLTFAIVAGAIIGFSFERISVEVTALTTLVALVVVFVVAPDIAGTEALLDLQKLFMGFANPALIAVLSLVIVGQALFQTGALDSATRHLTRASRAGLWVSFAFVLVAAAILSAVLNNTPVVVLLIPVLAALARERRMSSSRFLMAMNYATILGGSTTLIGSSTNLLVADVAARTTDLRLGMFDITVPGLVLAAAGLVYVLVFVPRLFSDRLPDDQTHTSGKQFIAELVLPAEHPLIGTESVAGLFPGLKHLTVRLVERAGQRWMAPFDGLSFQAGDRIVFGGVRRELAELGIIAPLAAGGGESRAGMSVAEAIVAPGSRIIGRSPGATGIEQQTGVHVAAIERRGRMHRGTFDDIRLEPGDVLLVAGSEEAFERLRGSRDLLLLERSFAALPDRSGSRKALFIFAWMVIMAATGILSITVAALCSALMMIVGGCLNVRQARRAFDGRIFMLVGASIAMASAMDVTGGATFLADSLVDLTVGGGPVVLLSALYILIAILTNVLSNNATAVLFTPIAVSAAAAINAPVEPFVVAVIFAANASFATPIGYQTNLLVMAPGNYSFRDYLTAGGPLVIVLWGVFTLFAPWYYGL
jgi:di/tricarboxylate transporter